MPKTATPRKPETVSRKLAETRNTSKNRSLSSLLGIGDNEKRLATDVGSGLNDVIGRGTIASLLGLPGDLGGAAENGLRSLLGLPQVVPYGGSEHIGQKMEQAGLVSDVRRPKTELLASLISPTQAFTAGYKAPQMARAGVKALDNLSAPSTLAMANKPASQRGIFAGINARNAPRDALEQGAKLLDEGADPRQVWKDLGVFRGADGKMRWEIDDSKAAFDPVSLRDINTRSSQPDLVRHSEYFDAYPKAAEASFTNPSDGAHGTYFSDYNQIGIFPVFPRDKYTDYGHYRRAVDANKSTILHENQHLVQNVEGFAGGGSLRDVGSYDDYQRLAGEAEARAVQARLNMNAEQRRAVYPFDSYDVPVNELIHADGNGVAMSVGNLGKMVAPQDEALRVAQANAAKPVSEGGLGLRPDNTPEERAAAMGYFDPQADEFYRGQHTAPMSYDGAPAYDLTGGGNVYPDDVYSSNAARYYGHGEPTDASLFSKLHSLRGKPDESVRVFRAVPSDVFDAQGHRFNHGDWITPNRAYAVEHGEGALNGDYKIIAGNVPARTMFTNGDSPYEFGLDKTQYFADGPASLPVMHSKQYQTLDRSRFAAFDPMRRDSSDLLAGLAPFGAVPWLRDEEP